MEIRRALDSRAVLAEAALWSPVEGALYWVDQMRPEIHRFDLLTGLDNEFQLDLPAQLGALVPRAFGGVFLAASDGISVIEPDFRSRKLFVNPIAALPRASYAKCDRQGRLWPGTTDRQETEPIGQLYRLDGDGKVQLIVDGFICLNGPSFSPDGRVMYHTQTHDRFIYAYDIDVDTGEARSQPIFAIVEPDTGVPDGSTIDSEGCLWSTHWVELE